MHPEEPTCPCCLPALGDSVGYRRMGGWRGVYEVDFSDANPAG